MVGKLEREAHKLIYYQTGGSSKTHSPAHFIEARVVIGSCVTLGNHNVGIILELRTEENNPRELHTALRLS